MLPDDQIILTKLSQAETSHSLLTQQIYHLELRIFVKKRLAMFWYFPFVWCFWYTCLISCCDNKQLDINNKFDWLLMCFIFLTIFWNVKKKKKNWFRCRSYLKTTRELFASDIYEKYNTFICYLHERLM